MTIEQTVENTNPIASEETKPVKAWDIIKMLAGAVSGVCASKVTGDILRTYAPIPGSKLTAAAYFIGIGTIGGAVGSAVSKYVEADLSGFDVAADIIQDYRKELNNG